MRYFLILVVIYGFFFTSELNAQKTISDNESILLLFPKGVDTDELQINYYITGSFGGYSNHIRIKPKTRSYKISTSHEGKEARTLKLTVSSPKYQVMTFDFPTLENQRKNIQLKFKPLGTVPFNGRILSTARLNPEKWQLQILYIPGWQCGYFGFLECLLGHIPITLANFDKSGRFTVNLPDFANDPIIASYKDNGEFTFRVKEKSGKLLFDLKPEKESKGFRSIQAALNYPGEIVFIPESEK